MRTQMRDESYDFFMNWPKDATNQLTPGAAGRVPTTWGVPMTTLGDTAATDFWAATDGAPGRIFRIWTFGSKAPGCPAPKFWDVTITFCPPALFRVITLGIEPGMLELTVIGTATMPGCMTWAVLLPCFITSDCCMVTAHTHPNRITDTS